MLKKFFFLLVVLIMSVSFCTAQLQKFRYSGIINAGAVFGSNPTQLQVQTIHGVKSGTWSAGAGVSVDDYFLQSFPVFIDIRKDIFKTTPNSPFVYAEGGVNLVGKDVDEGYERTDNSAGVFYEGGIGYKTGLSSRTAFNISAGYSYKSYREDKYGKAYNTDGFASGGWATIRNNRYTLGRLAFKIGIQF